MKAKTVVEKICKSQDIPDVVKQILYEHAVFEVDDKYRLTGKKLDYMKLFFAECDIPNDILDNRNKLKGLINKLIATNFRLKEHMWFLLSLYLHQLGPEED
ncbi:hypothetical protein [Terribacillus sp. DMT04]|uniref:hypothetical protein n=1 Tax=Terribacillus sp. DMT04 TaxID=2850441 RepID=UPI001C2C5CED|nr:hypothetical protein [Terribacillus sp. DMT04]QXE02560.1 hypothetical protein KS242_05070 [Terribacillus sp. DMT04]